MFWPNTFVVGRPGPANNVLHVNAHDGESLKFKGSRINSPGNVLPDMHCRFWRRKISLSVFLWVHLYARLCVSTFMSVYRLSVCDVPVSLYTQLFSSSITSVHCCFVAFPHFCFREQFCTHKQSCLIIFSSYSFVSKYGLAPLTACHLFRNKT